MKDLKAKNPRISVLYQDDDMGQSAVKGARESVNSYGLKLTAEVLFKRGGLDFLFQVLNLKRAGSEYIILFTIVRETPAVLKEAKKMGWSPQFLGTVAATNDKAIELASNAAKGYVGIRDQALLESDVPGIVEYKMLAKKYQPDYKELGEEPFNLAWVNWAHERVRKT